MFGLGVTEILIILVIALLVLGPKRLPEVARSLGRGLAEFRRASSEIRNSLSFDPLLEAPDETRPRAQPSRSEASPQTKPAESSRDRVESGTAAPPESAGTAEPAEDSQTEARHE